MKRPVLVAMSEARGGVGPVSFAGVREDERPASFGVEARFGLERHQGNGRREPATTAGRMSAIWSALADLGMRLGIESRRRYRVGKHHMTLENERDRQQEPAFLSPKIMVIKAHARPRVIGSQDRVLEGLQEIIVSDGWGETR